MPIRSEPLDHFPRSGSSIDVIHTMVRGWSVPLIGDADFVGTRSATTHEITTTSDYCVVECATTIIET